MKKQQETRLNCDQAIIMFKLTESKKRLTQKRFKDGDFTVVEWKTKLAQDNLL